MKLLAHGLRKVITIFAIGYAILIGMLLVSLTMTWLIYAAIT